MSMFDDDDHPLGGIFGGMGGMPGGMPGGAGRRTPRRPASPFGARSSFGGFSSEPHRTEPTEITRPLKVSLEDLYSGATKHLKVGRRLLNGSTEDRVLEIQVLPGWKSGTKIRFARAGNENADGEAQDLVFVVEEKPHDRFVRDGSDLITTQRIPLVDALTNAGGKRVVDGLDGRKIQVNLPSGVIKPGTESRVAGEGMPMRKEGSVRSKGDLVVKWEVVFPERLTSSQKEGIRKVLG